LAHQTRAEIEVVILEHDQGLAASCFNGGDYLVRE
jgi:hypothetical protein